MKKILLLILILSLKFASSKAQWVTIPDASFVYQLSQLYPSCMNGNLMDTTCSQIVNEDILFLNSLSISDLTGISYFDNLITLYCSANQLNSLPTLPSTLQELYCSVNQLNSLPILPSTLQLLECNVNQLTSLPTLPSTLQGLNCSQNQLTSLPALPSTLQGLSCALNQLSNLPTLPSALQYLFCTDNILSSLPPIPSTLQQLYCYNNQLTSLPAFPAVMDKFYVQGNSISCFTNLPQVFTGSVNIFNNSFTCVPNQTTYTASFPLCINNDPVNNPNSCPGVAIVGYINDAFIKNEYKIYPNPSNGVFSFFDYSNLKIVEVYSLLGEKIISQTSQKQIDLSSFSKGIYFAKINGEKVIKLVKE